VYDRSNTRCISMVLSRGSIALALDYLVNSATGHGEVLGSDPRCSITVGPGLFGL
jgi:hypothetical protein